MTKQTVDNKFICRKILFLISSANNIDFVDFTNLCIHTIDREYARSVQCIDIDESLSR